MAWVDDEARAYEVPCRACRTEVRTSRGPGTRAKCGGRRVIVARESSCEIVVRKLPWPWKVECHGCGNEILAPERMETADGREASGDERRALLSAQLRAAGCDG